MASSWVPGGLQQPIDRGYSVRSPDFRPDQGGEAINGANALLEKGDGSRVFLWVNNVESAFAMAGNTAQSHRSRRFYPHNFTQPSVTISGQTPNQYEYGRLAEFVRSAQLRSLNDDQALLTFKLFEGGGAGITNDNPAIRGKHQQIAIRGYVTRVDRITERFINAPNWTMEFVITEAQSFLGLHDQPAVRQRLKTIIDGIRHGGYEDGKIDSEKEPKHDFDKPLNTDGGGQ